MSQRTRPQPRRATGTTRRRPAAFTLVELITVIAVMAILITIGVPAFRSALASSDKALSESQFRIGMELGRQVAIGNASRDAAAVFMYDPYAPGGGRMSIVACVYVGTMLDWKDPARTTPGSEVVERDIFVPVPDVKPVQLPRSWMVRGFAPPGSLDSANSPNGWYVNLPGVREVEVGNSAPTGNWVFPENAFYLSAANAPSSPPPQAASLQNQGTNRQSFMVRFKAGTGSVDPSESRLCLVIDPAPSQSSDASGRLTEWREGAAAVFVRNRIDRATDLQRFVKQSLAARDLDGSGNADLGDDVARRLLLGHQSCDAVLCRPLTELALYREKSLVAGLGGSGVNQTTGTIYLEGNGTPDGPRVDMSQFGTLTSADVAQRTNLWLTGKLLTNNNAGPGYVETDTKLFAMDRYLGQGRKLGDDQEVTP